MLYDTVILSTAYLPPIQYVHKLFHARHCIIEQYEHFIKQTYRSRCVIYSPNGSHSMVVPLVNRNHKQAVKDIRISADTRWQELHWRTIESAYRRSPFFEYYEDDFRPIYQDKKFDFLIDLNEALLQVILPLIKIKPNYSYSTSFIKKYEDAHDHRQTIAPKSNLTSDKEFLIKPYSQVFENKCGFIENLSVIDLLFNQGNLSCTVL